MDKYYKVQYMDPISMSWVDIQKSHKTKEDALYFIASKSNNIKYRIMEVDSKKRTPITV